MHCHSLIFIFFSLIQLISARAFPQTAGPQLPNYSNFPKIPWSNIPRPGFGNVTNPNCFNGPTTRQCWGGGYSINTNIETTWPNTGRIVSYTLEVQNLTLAPDGHPRVVYGINGQFPGPTIRARWGDTLQITVKNSLTNNGTSFHWHGLRQFNSNPMDGTNGITECPLAPGQSRTYTFVATQHGTSWYHSHHSSQYSDGVWGSIIIDGPATANYDLDLGALPISDWFYETASANLYKLSRGLIRGAPRADNVLINGMNVNATGGGAYQRNTIVRGMKYRLRLVNTATNDNFKVSLDGHNLTVIASDFVAVQPFTVKELFIGIGQRYDVIIEANQPIDSYYFHVVPQAGCSNNAVANAVSIFTYVGAKSTTPAASTRNNGPTTTTCDDRSIPLVPFVNLDVPQQTIPQSSYLNVNLTIVQNTTNTQTLVQWNINLEGIYAAWDKPTLTYVREHNTSYPPSMNLINLPTANVWSFWVIQAVPNRAPPQSHPIHLHGHDFYVLGQGDGTYSSANTLDYINPRRRDVAMLPASGWLVLAFITDNPGAWLMHCHVAWHIDLGLGAQFLEQADQIPPLLDATAGWNQECSSWDTYETRAVYPEVGSGL